MFSDIPRPTLEMLATLEGLIPELVGLKLAQLASRVRFDHAIVEIGSYRGKSTAYLAAGSKAGQHAPVFAIDPWNSKGNPTGRHGFAEAVTRETFRRQTAPWTSIITAFRSYSEDMAIRWTKPVGLLYIDGSHTEKDVQRDWDMWVPLLAPGAVVAFDDYKTKNNPGVEKVVERLKSRFAKWEEGPHPLFIGWMP